MCLNQNWLIFGAVLTLIFTIVNMKTQNTLLLIIIIYLKHPVYELQAKTQCTIKVVLFIVNATCASLHFAFIGLYECNAGLLLLPCKGPFNYLGKFIYFLDWQLQICLRQFYNSGVRDVTKKSILKYKFTFFFFLSLLHRAILPT